jgi:Zn-dependent protease
MDIIREVFLVLVPMLLCLTVHEYSHARSALWLGDDTATRMGRLTLNPVAHADLFGTILLPLFAIVSQSNFFFGWAKPVPVNPVRFSRRFNGRRVTMRTGMMITAAAGPVSNIVFGLLAAALLKLMFVMEFTYEPILMLVLRILTINYVLAVFNFIPLPPLDGSKVLAGFLPNHIAVKFDALERNPFVALVILMALLGTGLLGKIIGPVVTWMLVGTDYLVDLGLFYHG